MDRVASRGASNEDLTNNNAQLSSYQLLYHQAFCSTGWHPLTPLKIKIYQIFSRYQSLFLLQHIMFFSSYLFLSGNKRLLIIHKKTYIVAWIIITFAFWWQLRKALEKAPKTWPLHSQSLTILDSSWSSTHIEDSFKTQME